MISVSSFTYKQLINNLVGKTVHFKSDCVLFPNFDVTGKVMSYYITEYELVFKVKPLHHRKTIDIGCNMKKLRYEIING